MRFVVLFLVLCSFVHSAPPQRKIPRHLKKQFTMNGQILVLEWYLDDTSPLSEFQVVLQNGEKASFYSREVINSYIEKAKRYYNETDIWLYQALEKYPLEGKDVVIVGSMTPWYESVVIAYGGRPTTIEYNKIVTDDERLTPMTVAEFYQNPRKFDVLISIVTSRMAAFGFFRLYGNAIFRKIGKL